MRTSGCSNIGDVNVDSTVDVAGVRRVDDPPLHNVVRALLESAVDTDESCDYRLSL